MANTAPAQNASKDRTVPPSTRAFAKDYAAFMGEPEVSKEAYAQAKALKNGGSNQTKPPPSTRQFAKAYKNFFDV